MRKKLSFVVITLMVAATLSLVGTGAAGTSGANVVGENDFDQMIIKRSKEVWEAYKTRNVAAIKALSGEDYAAFTQAGPSNLQQDIATIDKLTIESYT